MPKKATGPSRKIYSEKDVSAQLLGDFNPEGSRGYLFLQKFFEGDPSKNKMVSLALVFSKLIDVSLPRNYQRNKNLMIKWFDMNIDQIEAHSHKVIPKYEDEQKSKE